MNSTERLTCGSITTAFPPLRQPTSETADHGAVRLGSGCITAAFPPLRQPQPEIVDRGTVIRQGPISQLLAGSSFEVQIECSEPDRALTVLGGTAFGAHVQVGPDGLAISLPEGTERTAIAEINRLLVEGGISVYRLQHIQASLEAWFLQVTSRLGEDQ